MTKTRSNDSHVFPMPAGTHVEHLGPDLALLSFPLAEAALPQALTPAEQEVALQVYVGASNKQIAHARGVSARTIGNQLESIYRKLRVSSRAELVLLLSGRGGRSPR
jgi:DNA-binding CsgD family transcriptional regulator